MRTRHYTSGLLIILCTAMSACRNGVIPGDEEDNEAITASGCGVERWSVKTGTDAAAAQVNMTAQDTTIATMRALPVPAGLNSNSSRFVNSAEGQLWRLTGVTLTQYKLENDSDIHLVLADSAGATMIAELAAPSCVSGGAWASQISSARAAFAAKFTATGSFQTANVPVNITGVGFFDLQHGQTGVAPNGIEVHAILSVCFPGSSVSGCSATADFGLSASPASVTTARGASGTTSISVTASNGFSGSVTLSAGGLPAGASASFSAASVPAGSSSILTLTSGSAAAGSYTVTVTGTSGTLTHTLQIPWTISAGTQPDFSLAASPSSLTGAGTSSISVTALNGFSGTVALSASGVPSGASASLSPASVAAGGSSSLSLSPGTAAAGTYPVTVTGTSGSLSHTAQVSWTIPAGTGGGLLANGDFETGTLSGWTSTGSTAVVSTGAHGGRYAARVGSTTPSADSALTQQVTLPAGSPRLVFWYQIHCPDTVVYDWASVTVAGTTTLNALAKTCTNDGLWHSASVDLSSLAGQRVTLSLKSHDDQYASDPTYTLYDDVQITGGTPAPDFSLAANPASVTGAGSSSISVSGTNGFSGTVALSAAGAPAGASATLSPGSVAAGGSSTLTLSAGSAAAGTYSIVVTGTSGSLSHTAAVSWSIGATATPDFTLSLTSSSVTSTGSAAATDTVSVAPLNGFSAAVALSVSGVPAGASASFSPASIAGGSGTAALTLSPGTAPAGTYSLTVSGSGGNHTHTAALSWTLAGSSGSLQTVFIILMENHNWSSISGSASAPYINNTLLPQSSFALNYKNPAGIHPSLPNYLYLEAGTNFGILNDSAPGTNHQSTQQHLVTLLQNAGISWKSYQEGISGTSCPLTTSGLYAPKHNPMVYFDDVTNTLNASSANCIAHVRPYSELAADLQSNQAARYNFITPDMCNDMHNTSGCATSDSVRNGDTWLSQNVPAILNSAAFRNNGVLFITWDEGVGGDGPVGMIVLSPKAKGQGYSNAISYTHSSTLRTVQEIFAVGPLLGGAAGATNLSDLFLSFP
jgi:hypothetical protein